MNTLDAFARGEANRGKPLMVFDWEKAAEIIRERGAKEAEAGLMSDWEYTGGAILSKGKPVKREDTYTYLASTWARPQLLIEGEYIDCWKYQKDTPKWDAETLWPKEALKVFKAKKDFGTKWNKRMKEIGAERGTIEDLKNI
jgi:hypothetical protein